MTEKRRNIPYTPDNDHRCKKEWQVNRGGVTVVWYNSRQRELCLKLFDPTPTFPTSLRAVVPPAVRGHRLARSSSWRRSAVDIVCLILHPGVGEVGEHLHRLCPRLRNWSWNPVQHCPSAHVRHRCSDFGIRKQYKHVCHVAIHHEPTNRKPLFSASL